MRSDDIKDEFASKRDRDAWATIRGFVYQVDLTLHRWLTLAPDQCLELERGEDIDLISAALSGDVTNRSRLLEQVKHVEGNVTLRSPSTIGAIASAIEHLDTNPELNLSFQFTTTAGIGRERPSPINGQPGIKAWAVLAENKMFDAKSAQLLVGLRKLLWSAKQPDKLADETWQAYRKFVATAGIDEFLRLLRKFVWVTDGEPAENMEEVLCEKLVENGYAHDRSAAQLVYQRLFLYVFRTLTRKGIKRLTHSELKVVAAFPGMSEADKTFLATIETNIDALRDRVGRTESAVVGLDAAISGIKEQLGLKAALSNTITFDRPRLPRLVSRREGLVDHVNALLESATWISIEGSLSSGTSQLCNLVAEARSGECVWIDMEGLDGRLALQRLQGALEELLGPAPVQARRAWLAELKGWGPGMMFVLDSLPPLAECDAFAMLVGDLAIACCECGIKLLSSGPHNLGDEFLGGLPEGIVRSLTLPPLDCGDIGAILVAQGAPPAIHANDSLLRFLETVTGGNPTIVAAVGRFLRSRDWCFKEADIDALLGKEFAYSLNKDTVKRLVCSVSDESSRELLYRLSVVGWTFDMALVQKIADIEPKVVHPRERMADLMGLWVVADGEKRLRVSPLIEALDSADLQEEVKKRCHVEVASDLMARPLISEVSLLGAVNHFARAGESDRAGLSLAMGLEAYVRTPGVYGGLLLPVWAEVGLPETMRLGVRIYVRSLQTLAFHQNDRDVAYVLDDLVGLVSEASSDEAWALLHAGSVLAPAIAGQHWDMATTLVKKALDYPIVQSTQGGDSGGTPTYETLIVFLLLHLSQIEHLQAWMDFVAEIKPEQRSRAFACGKIFDYCLAISSRLAGLEACKPVDEKDWVALDHGLERIGKQALNLGLEPLWACLECTRISIKTEFLLDSQGGLSIGVAALKTGSECPTVQYILKAQMALSFAANKEDELACFWFEEAFRHECAVLHEFQLTALVAAAALNRKKNPSYALRLCEKGVLLATNSDDPMNHVLAFGELALFQWGQGESIFGMRALKRAAEVLSASRSDQIRWKKHCLGIALVADAMRKTLREGRHGSVAPELLQRILNPGGLSDLFSNVNPEQQEGGLSAIYFGLVEAAYSASESEWGSRTLVEGVQEVGLTARSMEAGRLSLLRSWALLDEDKCSDALRSVRVACEDYTNVKLQDPDADPVKVLAACESDILMNGYLPAVIRVCLLRGTTPQKARQIAAEMRSLCLEWAQSSRCAEDWIAAANLLCVFADEEACDGESLAAEATELLDKGKHVLGVAGLAISSLFTSMAVAIDAHIFVAGALEKFFHGSGMIDAIVGAPFFYGYWASRFQSSRGAFRQSGVFEEALSRARSASVSQRSRLLLKSVVSGLGVSPSAGKIRWLEGKPSVES